MAMRFVPNHRVRACVLAGLALLAGWVTTLPASAQQVTASAPQRIVAADARLDGDRDLTRLVLVLSGPVEASGFVMEKPDRVVIAFPEVNFQLGNEVGRKARGLVSGFRFGLFAPGRSRIVIDLLEPAEIARISTTPRPAGLSEVVIELKRTTRAAFASAAARVSAEQRRPPQTAIVPQTPAGDPRPVIVIDPGHGGIDPGAVTGTVTEKQIVLDFSLALAAHLRRDERLRVVMTRDDDRFLPLDERVNIARQAQAALFVSIHADSLSQAQDVRGATVYTGSDKATDAEAARLAAKENQVDQAAGIEIGKEQQEELSGILMDLALRETRAYSSDFAKLLVSRMGESVRMHRIPVRAAGFRVLRAPDVPSVLIELGYISSQKDLELLKSPEWREKAAGSVAQAIITFAKARQAALPPG
jgi:N-acetylmuramoyl-L-alanine amidase